MIIIRDLWETLWFFCSLYKAVFVTVILTTPCSGSGNVLTMISCLLSYIFLPDYLNDYLDILSSSGFFFQLVPRSSRRLRSVTSVQEDGKFCDRERK